jgi:hypothetical protein
MSRNAINFCLDALLLVLFVMLISSSAVLQFIFPPATQADGWQLWGMDYDAWHRVQTVCLGAMALAVLFHLILHWTWACGFLASRLSRIAGRQLSTNEATRTVYGVATLAMLLMLMGVMLTVGKIMVREPLPVEVRTGMGDAGDGAVVGK